MRDCQSYGMFQHRRTPAYGLVARRTLPMFGSCGSTTHEVRNEIHVGSRVSHQEEADNACSNLETVEGEAAYTFTRRSGVRDV
jgi:hypothetical protein